MNRKAPWLSVLAASLALSACDAFFETNLFKEAGLGQYELPSASELSSAELSELEEAAESPAFFEGLAEDEAKKDAVSDNLRATYEASSDPAELQGAAILYAEVQLKTTGAFDVVNGVFKAVDELAGVDFAAMTEADLTSFVEAAMPAEVLADETSFKGAVLALLAANEAYEAAGTSIGADGPASGVDAAAFVQGAIVAALVDGVPGADDAAKADALWAAVESGTAFAGTYAVPDFDDGALGSIMTASGLDLSSYGI